MEQVINDTTTKVGFAKRCLNGIDSLAKKGLKMVLYFALACILVGGAWWAGNSYYPEAIPSFNEVATGYVTGISEVDNAVYTMTFDGNGTISKSYWVFGQAQAQVKGPGLKFNVYANGDFTGSFTTTDGTDIDINGIATFNNPLTLTTTGSYTFLCKGIKGSFSVIEDAGNFVIDDFAVNINMNVWEK